MRLSATSYVRVTKEFHFEMAHALLDHDGPCKNIHGHSYRLFVTIKGVPLQDPQSPKDGMVMDFSDLKRIVHTEIVLPFDHAMVLNSRSPLASSGELSGQKLVLVDYQPTCENLVVSFAMRLKKILPAPLGLHHLLLKETDTSWAEWYADDNKF